MRCFGFPMIILMFTFLLPSNSYSWRGYVHAQMAKDGINTLPDHLHSQLVSIRLTVNEPDQDRVISHVNVGQCAWMIKKLALKCVKMIKAGEQWDLVYYTMGKATHYIQDLNSPHHGIGYHDEAWHKAFEGNVSYGFWESDDFDGFHRIENYKYFAYNAARFSKRYIKYCNKPAQAFFDAAFYKDLVDPLWNHAVNDCIDLWLTILWDGLGDKKYMELGLPPMVGSRAHKKMKFPKVKIISDK